MNYSSKLIEDAVNAFGKLPGIGKKTALRLVLYMLKNENEFTDSFTSAIATMRAKIKFCKKCNNISDNEFCAICTNTKRDQTIICVVENIRDVLAIEDTGLFSGCYHILGGLISPLEGVGPEDLNIDQLRLRLQNEPIKELIMALSSTIDGDTTIFYLHKLANPFEVKISTLSRGIAFGGEIEYADEITLGRSLLSRIPYQSIGEKS
jgi:recombination protein RecR